MGPAPGLGIHLQHLFKGSRRRRIEVRECFTYDCGDIKESDPVVEECGHGDLVGSVENGRLGTASAERLLRKP
jgi:hypothetical protein